LIGTNPLEEWMNDPLALTTELAFVEIIALASVDAVYVPPDIVSVAVLELVTPAAVEAVILPVIVSGPALALLTPVAAAARTFPVIVKAPAPLLVTPAEVDAVTLPMTLMLPVEELKTAPALVADPAVKFPVIFTVPVEELIMQFELITEAPITFPVTLNVPDPEHNTAPPDPALAAVQFPTMLAVAGDAAENVKQFTERVALLCVTFAVNVTPLLRTYVPVPALLNSVQVTFAVIVMTCVVEALASSAAPGTMPPTQVPPALKFPVAAERMSAIFYNPFAKINS
jgi:hypothetical protein